MSQVQLLISPPSPHLNKSILFLQSHRPKKPILILDFSFIHISPQENLNASTFKAFTVQPVSGPPSPAIPWPQTSPPLLDYRSHLLPATSAPQSIRHSTARESLLEQVRSCLSSTRNCREKGRVFSGVSRAGTSRLPTPTTTSSHHGLLSLAQFQPHPPLSFRSSCSAWKTLG